VTRYFFHLLGPDGRSDDLIGCEFENADAAYLEACRAAIEIGGEMLARREDPTAHRFEICDEHLGRISDVPFREVLRIPTRPRPQFESLHERLAENHAIGHRISDEIRVGVEQTRELLRSIQETMVLLKG
jgi:hypothetical protein